MALFSAASAVPEGTAASGILKPTCILLAAAGPDYDAFPEVFERFVQELPRRRGNEPPRIAVAVHAEGGNPLEVLQAYAGPLQTLVSCEVAPVLSPHGSPAVPA